MSIRDELARLLLARHEIELERKFLAAQLKHINSQIAELDDILADDTVPEEESAVA
jgi:hypothetical protein